MRCSTLAKHTALEENNLGQKWKTGLNADARCDHYELTYWHSRDTALLVGTGTHLAQVDWHSSVSLTMSAHSWSSGCIFAMRVIAS